MIVPQSSPPPNADTAIIPANQNFGEAAGATARHDASRRCGEIIAPASASDTLAAGSRDHAAVRPCVPTGCPARRDA
jgi:hypothetical protein